MFRKLFTPIAAVVAVLALSFGAFSSASPAQAQVIGGSTVVLPVTLGYGQSTVVTLPSGVQVTLTCSIATGCLQGASIDLSQALIVSSVTPYVSSAALSFTIVPQQSVQTYAIPYSVPYVQPYVNFPYIQPYPCRGLLGCNVSSLPIRPFPFPFFPWNRNNNHSNCPSGQHWSFSQHACVNN